MLFCLSRTDCKANVIDVVRAGRLRMERERGRWVKVVIRSHRVEVEADYGGGEGLVYRNE